MTKDIEKTEVLGDTIASVFTGKTDFWKCLRPEGKSGARRFTLRGGGVGWGLVSLFIAGELD